MKLSTAFAKLFLVLALAMTMLVAGFSVAAAPGGNFGDQNASQFCTTQGGLGFASHGACVSFFSTVDNPNAGANRVHFCQFLVQNGLPYYNQYDESIYFTSVGQCVSSIPKG